MATQTTNLKLSKAEQTDAILDTLRANNSNFDTLDTKIKEIQDELGDVELPIASATTLGGIKVGNNLTITEDGVLNALAGSSEGSGGVIILEASTDNVVDFDTLTEPGYYLIKNCSDTVGTTINSGFTSTNETARKDILLMISSFLNPNGDLYLYHTKSNTYSSIAEQRYAFNGTWQPWKRVDIPASWIASGTFPAGVSCNTPTADNHLANKAYVDSVASGAGGGSAEGITVLEASTENVIDFNTLTEAGYYLVKNCSDGGGTTLNSNVLTSTSVIRFADVTLWVREFITDAGVKHIYQEWTHQSGTTHYGRSYSASQGWNEWAIIKMPAGYVATGTFTNGMKCGTPTEDEHLVNKAYVDGMRWAASTITGGTLGGVVQAQTGTTSGLSNAIIRNIKAQTADLTAGTSTLTTGDIYFVYE